MNRSVPTAVVPSAAPNASTGYRRQWVRARLHRHEWLRLLQLVPQRTRAVAAVLSLMVLSCLALVQSTETHSAGTPFAAVQAEAVISAEATVDQEPATASSILGAITRELDMPFFSFAGLTRATRL
ncbi:MAG: hypothetical protein KDI51_12860 [Xanthomonadales bacterium]|nr:hypothetical protein [Xanthomonadales bacterium]MCB1635477.1 hypothetical protein [Xanthomonadales bacterium]